MPAYEPLKEMLFSTDNPFKTNATTFFGTFSSVIS